MRTYAPGTQLLVATALSLVSLARTAHADEAAAPPAAASASTPPDRHPSGHETTTFRAGALAGIGFPRPLALEGLAVLGEHLVVGAELAGMPAVTLGAGPTQVGSVPAPFGNGTPSPVTMNGVTVSLWSLAGDARWFPFGGPFFVGLRAGHQHVDASTTLDASYGTIATAMALDSWFFNPRVGLLWKPRGGLAFGMEAGVQVPVGTQISSSVPLAPFPTLQHTAEQLGGTVLPTVDLLRLGFLL